MRSKDKISSPNSRELKAKTDKTKSCSTSNDPDNLNLDAMDFSSNTCMRKGKVVHRRSSKFSGDIIVEELPSKFTGCVIRRMRFLSNLDLEQTEAKLVLKKNPEGISEYVADPNYIPYMW